MANVGEVEFKITADGGEAKKEINEIGNSAEDTGDKLKNVGEGAAQAAKIAATAITALGAALGAVAKQCVDAYADFEQLTGGVETLFGDAADTVSENAAKAFQTVGLSANDYMETVTGFSASLIASLDGDTAVAAEKADRAITDMADNANKMGSSIESIQNAYQGFAKQNYTMLDNLKLGYGGTKTEMERLLKDAQAISGIEYDLDSYADIIDAIGVIQDKMGITGTTAKEASETISGSINAMKAAWENLLVGIADPEQSVADLTKQLTDSIQTVEDNVMPRLLEIFANMGDTISELANGVLPMIPQTISAMLPSVVDSLGSILNAVVKNGADLAAAIVDYLPDLISSVGDILDDLMPTIVEAMGTIADAIADNADDVVSTLIDTVVDFLSEDFPEITPAGVEQALKIVTALVKGITDNAGKLAESIPAIIGALLQAILDALPDVIAAGEDMAQSIRDAVIHFDWANFARDLALVLVDVLEQTSGYLGQMGSNNPLAQMIGTMIDPTGGVAVKMGTDLLGNVVGWDNIRDGINAAADAAEEVQDKAQDAYDAYNDLAESVDEYNKKAEETEKRRPGRNGRQKYIVEGTVSISGRTEEEGADPVKTFEEQIASLEHLYAIHQKTEEEYLQERLALLNQYRDEEDEEWWADYDDTVEKIQKLSNDKISAEKKAAKEEQDTLDKAAKEQADALKESVSDKFRDLETEQLENGYDDQWLIDQKNAFIETLDHESDLYKDYHLKMLKEQESYNSKAQTAETKAVDERQKELQKLFDSVESAQEKLSSSLDMSVSDLFKTETTTDARTGGTNKTHEVNIEELEKQLEAKRQLPEKVAELLDSGASVDFVKELLKLDPTDALIYAQKLLENPTDLSKITAAYKEDESLSDQLAAMVTENSADYENLGAEAGETFGEAFFNAFGDEWQEKMGAILENDDLYNFWSSNAPSLATAAMSMTGATISDISDMGKTGRVVVEVTGKLTGEGDTLAAIVNGSNEKSDIRSDA